MNLLQKIFISVLNPIFGITKKIDIKVRERISDACLIIIAIQFFVFTSWQKYGIEYGYSQLFISNTVLLLIVIVFSVKEPLVKVENNKLFCIPWFLCTVLIIISGLHHNITPALMFFAGTMLFVFPCLYFVWNNRGDYETLFIKASRAIIAAMIIFNILQLAIAPLYSNEAYSGIAVNPNSIGIASTAGVISSLYLIVMREKHIWIYVLSAGMGAAFAVLSASRASVLAIMLVMISFLVCYLRSCKMRFNGRIKKSIAIVLILTAVCIGSVSGYRFILSEITPAVREFVLDKVATQAYAEDDTQENNSALVNKFMNRDGVESMSSGRIYIWKSYIRNLNLVGHERGDQGLYIEEMYGNYSAHNTYLEIAYRSGIFAGLAYAFIAVYAAVYAFRFMFGKKIFDYRLSLIPMAVLAFGVLSNLERALYPLEKAHIFLFFIALAPMFMKRRYDQKQS